MSADSFPHLPPPPDPFAIDPMAARMAAMQDRMRPRESDYSPETRLTPQADLNLYCDVGGEEPLVLEMYVHTPIGHRDKDPTEFILNPKVFDERFGDGRKGTNERIGFKLPISAFGDVQPYDVLTPNGGKKIMRKAAFDVQTALAEADPDTSVKLRALLLRQQYLQMLAVHTRNGGAVADFDDSGFRQAQRGLMSESLDSSGENPFKVSPKPMSVRVLKQRKQRGNFEERSVHHTVDEVRYIYDLERLREHYLEEERLAQQP